jgi:hypothetical protein
MGEEVQLTTNDTGADPSIIQNYNKLIESLEMIYKFDNPDEINSFLFVNDFLKNILLEAPKHIYKFFDTVPLHLEFFFDPDDDTEALFILIKSPYTTEENIRHQDQLIEQWFSKIPIKARRKLSIATALLQENKLHEFKSVS